MVLSRLPTNLFKTIAVALLLTTTQVVATPFPAQSHNDYFWRDPKATPADKAERALIALHTYHDIITGLYGDDTDPWYQSALAAQVTLDFILSPAGGRTTNLSVAQLISGDAWKTLSQQRKPVPWWPQGEGDFRADSTDDTAWWALTSLDLYALQDGTKWVNVAQNDTQWLDIAKKDAEYIEKYRDEGACAPGIVWSIEKMEYVNAISNGLYGLLNARLHNVLESDKTKGKGDGDVGGAYLDKAKKQWEFIRDSGMINKEGLINDGLKEKHGECVNNGGMTWTYNQGVVIGALVELFKATNDVTYLEEAQTIANAVLASPILMKNGFLVESCEKDGHCDIDAPIYKGIFAKYLGSLNKVLPGAPYQEFLIKQADSVYKNVEDDGNSFEYYGLNWDGPAKHMSLASQISACNLLVSIL